MSHLFCKQRLFVYAPSNYRYVPLDTTTMFQKWHCENSRQPGVRITSYYFPVSKLLICFHTFFVVINLKQLSYGSDVWIPNPRQRKGTVADTKILLYPNYNILRIKIFRDMWAFPTSGWKTTDKQNVDELDFSRNAQKWQVWLILYTCSWSTDINTHKASITTLKRPNS
jgi:hypothetical protein